jgi:hypothetical protein
VSITAVFGVEDFELSKRFFDDFGLTSFAPYAGNEEARRDLEARDLQCADQWIVALCSMVPQACVPRLIGITFLGSSQRSIRSAQCCISFVREPISASGPCFL